MYLSCECVLLYFSSLCWLVFPKLRTNVLQLSVVRCLFCCSLVYGYTVFIVNEGWLCCQSVCLYSALHAVHAEQFVNCVRVFSVIIRDTEVQSVCMCELCTVCSRNVDTQYFLVKKQQRRNLALKYSLRLLSSLHCRKIFEVAFWQIQAISPFSSCKCPCRWVVVHTHKLSVTSLLWPSTTTDV